MGGENWGLVSLLDGCSLLATCALCLMSLYTHICCLENLNLSRYINVIACFVKEFIMLLNFFFKLF